MPIIFSFGTCIGLFFVQKNLDDGLKSWGYYSILLSIRLLHVVSKSDIALKMVVCLAYEEVIVVIGSC